MLWRPELELNLDLYIDPYLVLYVALCWGAAPNEVSGVQRGLVSDGSPSECPFLEVINRRVLILMSWSFS